MNKTLNLIKIGLALVCLTVALACGGGGGGGGTSGGGGGGGSFGWTSIGAKPEPGVYVEFLRGGTPTDPLNLSVGDSVQVVLANYDVAGTRTVLSGSTFSLSGGGGAFSLSGNTLTVKSSTTSLFTINAVNGSLKASQQGHIASGTVRASGQILASDGTTPVPYVQVELYDATSKLVGAGLTDKSGNFSIATTSSAKFLGIAPGSVTSSYFRMTQYNGKYYSTTGTTCGLALPAVSGGAITVPMTIYLVRLVDGPPPPPNACGS